MIPHTIMDYLMIYGTSSIVAAIFGEKAYYYLKDWNLWPKRLVALFVFLLVCFAVGQMVIYIASITPDLPSNESKQKSLYELKMDSIEHKANRN